MTHGGHVSHCVWAGGLKDPTVLRPAARLASLVAVHDLAAELHTSHSFMAAQMQHAMGYNRTTLSDGPKGARSCSLPASYAQGYRSD